MNYILLISAILILTLLVGSLLLPDTTSTTKNISFDASIDEVWSVYNDPASQPDWRPDIADVSVIDNGNSWTETLKRNNIKIHFEIIEAIPRQRLVLKVNSPNHFIGEYIAEFKQDNGSTIGTFTEKSTSLGYFPKIMRFLFFDQEKFMDQYASLAMTEIKNRRTKSVNY